MRGNYQHYDTFNNIQLHAFPMFTKTKYYFIDKLKIAAGIKSGQKENDIDQNSFEILHNDTVDVVFAKTFLHTKRLYYLSFSIPLCALINLVMLNQY